MISGVFIIQDRYRTYREYNQWSIYNGESVFIIQDRYRTHRDYNQWSIHNCVSVFIIQDRYRTYREYNQWSMGGSQRGRPDTSPGNALSAPGS